MRPRSPFDRRVWNQPDAIRPSPRQGRPRRRRSFLQIEKDTKRIRRRRSARAEAVQWNRRWSPGGREKDAISPSVGIEPGLRRSVARPCRLGRHGSRHAGRCDLPAVAAGGRHRSRRMRPSAAAGCRQHRRLPRLPRPSPRGRTPPVRTPWVRTLRSRRRLRREPRLGRLDRKARRDAQRTRSSLAISSTRFLIPTALKFTRALVPCRLGVTASTRPTPKRWCRTRVPAGKRAARPPSASPS
jgi:hypothetical protein